MGYLQVLVDAIGHGPASTRCRIVVPAAVAVALTAA
jgi:hypothetical protein